MATWFETRVRYEKMMDNGVVKKVTEPYLVDALSFAEAEARTIEEIRPFMSGEFSVSAARKTRIAEIFGSEDGSADRFYLVKAGFITFDEKTGAEKRTPCLMLVHASGFDDAVRRFKGGMKGTVSDYEMISVAETAIMDVFHGKPEPGQED